ncbi:MULTISPECIES: response regulator [Leptolyngbya]|uniref:response regulator n=1 Tax=Leptolyngbya TaxID=47251 RepID=UPI00329A603A
MIAQSGAVVEQVATAADFFAALESFLPHLVISDIEMPEIDGYTLLRQVRSRGRCDGRTLQIHSAAARQG